MKRKLNSFMIIKFDSKSLKRQKFKTDITLKDARREGTVIKLAENTFLEVVQKTLGKDIDFDRVNEISREIKKIGKEKNSNINRRRIGELVTEQDALIFIPEIVLIEFADNRHYRNILKQHLIINEKRYKRVLAGAGNIRGNSVFFIQEELYDPVMGILNNGRNENKKLNPAKFSAYFGLYASAGMTVSAPKFVVIPDYSYKRMATVDWVDEKDNISEKSEEITLNAFDGQGLVSPAFSKVWAEELEVEYVPSAFIFRAPFMKGQVVTFDFHLLAEENNIDEITDIWGDTFSVSDIDCVFSESQAKLWDSYSSMEEYVQHMDARNLPFRISRFSHKNLRKDTSSNYMYLQVLDLDDDDVEDLCSYTVEHFKDIQVADTAKTALFLSGGDIFSEDFGKEEFDTLDIVGKAILSYPDLLNERYMSSRISSSLSKKKKDAKLGKLLFKGNYAPVASDPYAHAQFALGLNVTGILSEKDHHSSFWISNGVDKVGAARSPLTHNSEMQAFDITDSWMARKWYEYLDTVFIFPFMSLDTLHMADSDFDGDLIFTTDHSVFIEKSISGNPINYEHGKAEEITITESSLSEGDFHGMNSKIGFITNSSSSLHCLKYEFDEGSEEWNEIEHRLKIFRVLQGEEIDSAKNAGRKKAIPQNWSKWDKENSEIENRVLSDRRPYFTRYRYSSYDRKYREEMKSIGKYCWSHFGMPYEEILLLKERTKKMNDAIINHEKYFSFIMASSPMNAVCWHMESELDKISVKSKKTSFDYTKLYSSPSAKVSPNNLKKMKELMNKYLAFKKAWRNSSSEFRKDIWHIIDSIGNDARNEITSNETELADLCVSLISKTSRADSFVWTVFGDLIVENILNRHGRQMNILVKNIFGDEEFLFEKYTRKKVMV